MKNEITYPYQIVYLSLTNRCNLRCKHCVASACIEEVDHMNTEDWKKVIVQVLVLNPEQINLTGGEPLIRPDFCEILEYLRANYKGAITLSTNALLLNDRLMEIIKRMLMVFPSVLMVLIPIAAQKCEEKGFMTG